MIAVNLDNEKEIEDEYLKKFGLLYKFNEMITDHKLDALMSPYSQNIVSYFS